MELCRGSLAVLVVLLSAPLAWAQPPAGPEFRVNTYTTGIQNDSTVALDAAGNFVVVWQSHDQDGGYSWDVFGRRYDNSGTPRGPEFQLNTLTTRDQLLPSVAADPAGNFLVVWENVPDVFARLFDASGAPRGPEFRVNTSYGMMYKPSVASDANGNFVVVWDSTGDVWGIVGRRYDSTGAPRGGEFRVDGHPYLSGYESSVAADAAGNFVVVWARYSNSTDVFGRRFDASGTPLGTEFRVNTYTTGDQLLPTAGSDAAGHFLVVWESQLQDGSAAGVFAQRYDASGTPQGGEFRVNTYTTSAQGGGSVAADAAGNFVVVWSGYGQDGKWGAFGRIYDPSGVPRGPEFQVNSEVGHFCGAPAAGPAGNFVVSCAGYAQDTRSFDVFARRFGGLNPAALAVDTTASAASDGNGVLEPGETVDVRPSWSNLNEITESLGGEIDGFTGPPAAGVTYSILDRAGAYGAVTSGTTAQCSDCYEVGVGFDGTRPSLHWDTTLTESLTLDGTGHGKPWRLHIGESFADVPKTNGYYRFVEILLHNGVTAGCGASTYCPGSGLTREAMAVYALIAKEGSAYVPPPCVWQAFGDVPISSPYCRWIEELVNRGVATGCGSGNYCPTAEVSREQMPVFMLRTLEPALTPSDCITPVFGDVPASSPYCRWIEELARRGVVTGCGERNYCPASAVTREQMAVFISATFGLTLYGP